MKSNKLTRSILVSIALGVGAGYAMPWIASLDGTAAFSKDIKLLDAIFTKLVKQSLPRWFLREPLKTIHILSFGEELKVRLK